VPLDHRREWFRYHHLFGDLLRQRLGEAIGEAELSGLYQTASAWFEQHGLMDEAIGLALSAPDYDRAARLIELHGPAVQIRELHTRPSMSALPPGLVAQHIHLLAMRAWALLASGQPAETLRDLQTIEQVAGITEEDWKRWVDLSDQARAALLEVTVMRMRFWMDQGKIDRVLEFAQQVLSQLTDDRQVWLYNTSYDLRPPVRFMVGVVREMRGELHAAEEEFRATAVEGVENPHIVALALGHLGSMQAQQGQLRAAADTYRQAFTWQRR
jgi:LuxR family maltose regulon positive regulatory protein